MIVVAVVKRETRQKIKEKIEKNSLIKRAVDGEMSRIKSYICNFVYSLYLLS
jgi:hypothetical protein